MASPVEQIKERLGIEEVIASYITLDKAGTNFKARCPFHQEKTPSFFVSPNRNGYYCFGCQAKGDIFSFVEQYEGVDFLGALRILAGRAGVTLTKEAPEKAQARERLYAVMEEASHFFEATLLTHKKALEYVIGRGLTMDTIKEWRLGYAPLEWRTLGQALMAKGFTEAELLKAGLIKRPEADDVPVVGKPVQGQSALLSRNNKSPYDRFRGRVMFPLFDPAGRVIAFSGRILQDDNVSAKYLNSPETELFNKSKVLYGFHKAKQAIREKNRAVLVEGQMDLLMSHQAGFAETIAVSGTALTPDHLSLLRRFTPTVIMAFDADKAGLAAAERHAAGALIAGFDVRAAVLPESATEKKEDPAELILRDPKLWEQALSSPPHIIEFLLSVMVKSKMEERVKLLAIKTRLLPLLKNVPSAMEEAYFIELIAKSLGIPQSSVKADVETAKKQIIPTVVKEHTPVGAGHTRQDSLGKRLFGILFWQETVKEPVIKSEDITMSLTEFIPKEVLMELRKKYEKESVALSMEAEISHTHAKHLVSEVVELKYYFAEEYLKQELGLAMSALSHAEKIRDPETSAALIIKCQELSAKLSSIARLPKN